MRCSQGSAKSGHRWCRRYLQREDCCGCWGPWTSDRERKLWRVVTPEALPTEKCRKAGCGVTRRSREKRQGRNPAGLESRVGRHSQNVCVRGGREVRSVEPALPQRIALARCVHDTRRGGVRSSRLLAVRSFPVHSRGRRGERVVDHALEPHVGCSGPAGNGRWAEKKPLPDSLGCSV